MMEILAFLFVLGLLIFVHELGHFAVAKWCGIRVETFSLGFPPKMVGFRRGDTEYRISWIPLGGYVKMAGERPDEGDIQGRPYEFMSKPVWQRALVILAGPAMNYFLAVLLFFGILWYEGKAVPVEDQAKIGTVLEDSPASAAGLQSGDVVIAIDDASVGKFEDMYTYVTSRPNQEINIVWLRGVDTLSANVVTDTSSVLTLQGEVDRVGRIGVGQYYEMQELNVAEAFVAGLVATNLYVVEIFSFVGRLITGSISTKLIGGPLFIAQAAGQAAKRGFLAVLMLAAILSVNLCIVNLIPIPVLDGGQLLFLGIEKIKGSPVSLKGRMVAQQIGLLFLILLIIVVTSNDIWRINIFGW